MSVLAACSGATAAPGSAYGSPATAAATLRSGIALPVAAATRAPAAADSVLGETAPGALTAAFARTLFTRAPVVIVADDAGTAVADAAADARAAHAPVLLAAKDTHQAMAQLAASVGALHPADVLAVGLPAAWRGALTALLHGVKVVGQPTALPATRAPAALSRVAVLVPSSAKPNASVAAVTATARAAGAAVIGVTGTDPRTDPAAIAALARLRPEAVVAIGAQFGPATRLAGRIAVAETGRQLPGGGQVLFPGHRLVALYGHPGTPGLGVLGEQDLTASIDRARQMAAAYRPLSGVPVVPAFEIIASVAEASPGPDGSYSYETPVSELLPWVREATADGLYVVLDLQPGRASLLAQAEYYQSLLELPDVGLALDAEWKLQPGQEPLRQIGHVDISEVNSVVDWLAALTARHALPQKLLVLHQFQLAMLTGERYLDTSHDDLSIVIHMDGQGTPGVKQGTWNAVTAAAPRGVFFGWKNFLVKDHPMLTPTQTMREKPTPVMISYQ
ncbi:MAG: hypothetical protein ACRDNO_21335 [Trebonia sp.]